MVVYVPWSKVAILGMVIPPFNRNPYNGYINRYYWVDDHPLLYGNIGSLDPSSVDNLFSPPKKASPTNEFRTHSRQRIWTSEVK